MTLAATWGCTLSSIVDRISLDGFPAEIKLSVRKGNIIEGTVQRHETLVVEMKTRHRDNVEAPWLVATESEVPLSMYSLDFYFSKEAQFTDFLRWIRLTIERVLLHELSEQMKFDGQRFFDVHAEIAAEEKE